MLCAATPAPRPQQPSNAAQNAVHGRHTVQSAQHAKRGQRATHLQVPFACEDGAGAQLSTAIPLAVCLCSAVPASVVFPVATGGLIASRLSMQFLRARVEIRRLFFFSWRVLLPSPLFSIVLMIALVLPRRIVRPVGFARSVPHAPGTWSRATPCVYAQA